MLEITVVEFIVVLACLAVLVFGVSKTLEQKRLDRVWDDMRADRQHELELGEIRSQVDEIRSQVRALEHQVKVNIKVDLEILQEQIGERERDVEELRWKLDGLEGR